MAEPLIITPEAIVVRATSSISPAYLDLRQAIDISRWQRLDVSVGILSCTANLTFKLEFLSAPAMDSEDPGWNISGASPTRSLVGAVSETITASSFKGKWINLTLPLAGTATALSRYLRWRAWNSANGEVSFYAEAIVHPKGS